MTSSASNHVPGVENGSETGWWTHTLSEGSGRGYSSGTSWGVPWSYCYDETVSYPGFVDYRYYGQPYGGGSGEEDCIAYVGDAFSDATGPSSDGMFPFAYSEEELLFGQAQGRIAQQAMRVETAAIAGQSVFAEARRRQEGPGGENGNGSPPFILTAAKDELPRAEAAEVTANGEASAAGGDGSASTWRWWNPFTWFSWGIDWSDAIDQELAVVRQLNQTFGTAHTRLDQFTAEERAMIERALGQKFNWEAASAIRASERDLQIREKVLLGSQVSLVAAGVADAAAGGVAVYEAATGTTFLVEGVLVGGRMGSGGILQIRPAGRPPLIRFDYHAIKPGGAKVPHIDSPPLGWHHWPWE